MATFAINSNTDIEALVGRTGDDTVNINGFDFDIDEDTHYGINATVGDAMGNITVSATLGGNLRFRGDATRIIPYDNGSGNVPTYGTAIQETLCLLLGT